MGKVGQGTQRDSVQSEIYFGPDDTIYVTDSESDDVQNPGWEMGIRIGDANTGWIRHFVRFPWGDPRQTRGAGAEFVAVDNDGNLYAGEPFRITACFGTDSPAAGTWQAGVEVALDPLLGGHPPQHALVGMKR